MIRAGGYCPLTASDAEWWIERLDHGHVRNSNGKTKPRPGPRTTVGRSRNGLSAGTKIVAAIEEATEILRAEGLESEQLTIRTYQVPPAPRVCRPGDV